MIKLENVSKFFNNGKANEIKAVNNTSLTLDKGLVMLVGKSGCGKTTLLNIIGGLERPDSGSITVGDTTIHHYQCEAWDKLRNREIGYIFQNYNLIDELTVYQNLELALKLAGVDPATYEERIRYALSLVGMEKYVLRHPNSLSGGQQQRIGIARAIVKGSNIIIADEPTGNLDDTNTVAVMQLLKGLSKHCLVVVVTHEEDLAAFYSDRIIRIKDGVVISDEENTSSGNMSHRASDHIYLGDMQRSDWKSDDLDISVFRDDTMANAKLSIVCQNGRILLQVEGSNKVSLVTNDSTIVLDPGKYEDHREKYTQALDIDTEVLSRGSGKPSRIFTFKQVWKETYEKIRSKIGVRRRNPFRTLYITSLLFVILLALVAPGFVFDRDSTVEVDDKTVVVYASQETAQSIVNDVDIDDVHILDHVLYGNLYLLDNSPFNISVSVLGYYSNNYISAIPFSWVQSSVKKGSLKKGEFYMDNMLYDRMKEMNLLNGIANSPEELIGRYFYIGDTYGDYIYFDPIESYVTLADGSSVSNASYKLVGFVNRNQPIVYFSDEDYNALPKVVYNDLEYKDTYTLLYCANPTKFIKAVRKQFPRYSNTTRVVTVQYNRFVRQKALGNVIGIFIASGALLIQFFCLHRMAKSDYMGKIKLYSQYRAVGVGRNAIYGKISLESAIVSVFSSLRGWLVGSAILWLVQRILSSFGVSFYYYPLWLALVCAAFLVGFAQMVNLLAPAGLLSRTPAYMMSKYDI